MNLAQSVLGSTAVKSLQLTAGEHVLRIGKDTLTRAQLARVGCFNFMAAKNLSAVLKTLDVPNLRHVFDKVSPAQLAVPRMGVISLAVLGAAFEALHIGGATPLEAYVRKHRDNHLVTFYTLKHHELAERARERKDRKRRKAQRRDQAHELRVERFDERQQSAV